jgi:gluconate 5-dehydrogenase
MDQSFLARTFGLPGRTALVTGGCSGLGLAIAQALGHAGARVLVNGRQAGHCEEAVRSLMSQGLQALPVPFDVGDEAAVAGAFARLRDQDIEVDVLVTSAGTQDRRPVTEMTLAQWHALMAVHVDGAFNCARAVLPGMVSRGFGRIVLMSSVAGQAAMPNIAAYASAKGAIAAFARALATEYGPHGITANAIAPGFARTGFTQALQDAPEFQRFIAAAVPAGRWAEPDEIAPSVVYLASAAGAFVNGHVLTIDGGLLAHL